MSTHLCWECALAEDYMESIQTLTPMGSTYRVEKFLEHMRPKRIYDLNSIFVSNSTAQYKDWFITSSMSGSMEVDDRGRTSFVWFAGKQIGATFHRGKFSFATDAVKLVLPFAEDRVHAFPVSSTGYQSAKCARCGDPIIW